MDSKHGKYLRRVLSLLILMTSGSATAQIALVQSTGLFQNGNGTTVTGTFAAAPKVGNTVIVAVWTWSGSGAAAITVSDSKANTYTYNAQAASSNTGKGWGNAAVVSAPVTTTGSGFAVKVSTPFSSSQLGAVALEYSGISAVDKTNTAIGTSGTATISTAATGFANELVIASLEIVSPWNTDFISLTPTTGYTVRAVELDNLNYTSGLESDQIVSPTGVQSITWTGGYAFAQWAAAIATFKPTGSVPDHYAISDAGTAVNCAPTPVTITAHNASHVAVPTSDTITVTTSTSHGDWALSTGSGTLTPGSSNSGSATYTYSSADNGTVILSLRDTYAETVTINVVDGVITQKSGSAIASEQPPLTFVSSGFRITNASNVATTIPTQIAGKTSTASLALQAVRTDTNTGACTTVFPSGSVVNVNLGYQCNNPTSCIAGQGLAITNNSTTTNIASNPNGVSTSLTSVPLKFSTANSEAPFTLNYSDVGQIDLIASYTIPLGSGVGSGNTLTGASQFVVQPYSFTLSNIKCTTFSASTCAGTLASPGNNPGASAASGPAFIQAGQAFSVTATAINFLGVATPNYGREVPAEGVKLTANLVQPASGVATALNNSSAFGGFAAGVATGTTFNWPQVGIVTLTPNVADGSYLGTGNVVGSTSGNVGRFIPDHFAAALNAPLLGTTCVSGAFSYLGQPLTYTVAPVATVTASAADGTATTNYTGSFFKLTNSSLTGRAYTPTPASPALDLSGLPATTVDPVIADLGTGQATLTFSAGTGIKYSRGSAIVPFNANITLAINVIDSDGASAANPVTFGSAGGIGFNGGPAQWYGRLSLRNAAGSELLDLPVPLHTEYYASVAQGFVQNSADSCTTGITVAFDGFKGNLAAGQTCVRDSGLPGVSGQGCSVAAPSRFLATAAGGDFNLILAAPGAGHSGSVILEGVAPAWLQYPWTTAGSPADPIGIPTFGLFQGSASRIYQREIY